MHIPVKQTINMPMQSIPPYTLLLFDENGLYRGKIFFFLFLLQSIDCGYSLELHGEAVSCIPQFYYIKVGFKGLFIARTCFCDGKAPTSRSSPHFSTSSLTRSTAEPSPHTCISSARSPRRALVQAHPRVESRTIWISSIIATLSVNRELEIFSSILFDFN